MAVWNRSRDDGPKDEDEFVSLADDEHAWWAAREDLARPWSPKARTDEAEASTQEASAFKRQFTSESLFNWADGTDTFTDGEAEVDRDPTSPFAILGVSSGASWDEIVAAHRQLAKLHHPDRLQGADDETRVASELTMRHVNAAYRDLRERYKPS